VSPVVVAATERMANGDVVFPIPTLPRLLSTMRKGEVVP